MNRNEVEKYFELLGSNNIDELYIYSCLLSSGFDKNCAYKNISLLKSLFLKDENNFSISILSDILYDIYEDINVEDLSVREVLQKIYIQIWKDRC